MKDKAILNFYDEIMKGDLGWWALKENDGLISVLAVCKEHEKKIRSMSLHKRKSVCRKMLGSTIPDPPLSSQRPTAAGPTPCLASVRVGSSEGGARATFVSDISSNAYMASKFIKANTIVYGSMELVVSLTTSTLVNLFAVDAIIMTKLNKLYDTDATNTVNHTRVLHGGVEMDANELFHPYLHV